MQWTVQVGVALLNVVWVAFFLQPDPLLVFVQRRSTDTYEEFCIKPPPDMNWISTVQPDNIRTASEEPVQRTSTDSSEEVFLQTTSEMKQTWIVQPDNINAASEEYEPGNLHEPGIRRKFETNPVGPPHQWRPASLFVDGCCFGFAPRRVPKRFISSYYVTGPWCPMHGVILVIQERVHICVDPSLPWVYRVMESLDQKYF
ncbi:uncharacterized protein LOC121176833 isoform X1 [Toxotes jaculatrix]|uniref:uncharacterized protein LOC121176833 isoform X1 n=1 Tax=Toxotes jaculatrix TaxID=941984 RepID=UPI001B3AB1DE|nr:uncharacterized protein LOC121176833 isoform X1 [Toxotes jaculatrix]